VNRQRLRLLVVALLLVSASGGGGAAEAPERVVLVVAASNPVKTLDAIDLKRLFLGIPVVSAGRNLHALLNESSERLQLIFQQHVVGMSQPTYERRLLQLTLEQGRRMPESFLSNDKLLEVLAADSSAVSYAWASTVEGNPRLRVVRELWRE
jgi:hypothetical protein